MLVSEPISIRTSESRINAIELRVPPVAWMTMVSTGLIRVRDQAGTD